MAGRGTTATVVLERAGISVARIGSVP